GRATRYQPAAEPPSLIAGPAASCACIANCTAVGVWVAASAVPCQGAPGRRPLCLPRPSLLNSTERTCSGPAISRRPLADFTPTGPFPVPCPCPPIPATPYLSRPP